MFKRKKTSSKILPSKPLELKQFEIMQEAPINHKYYSYSSRALSINIIQKENKILQECLPPNIWVKSYENKIHLYSIMIAGPSDTPYEHGLFMFDAILPEDYPLIPPKIHYYSYCYDKINPNLYTNGLVCLSLLGTWGGFGCELWTKESTLLQVIVSIQGLILVKEPYYNEPGHCTNYESSRKYNIKTALQVIEHIISLMKKSDSSFEKEIHFFINENNKNILEKIAHWVSSSWPIQDRKRSYSKHIHVNYPLLPMTQDRYRLKMLEDLLKLQLKSYLK